MPELLAILILVLVPAVVQAEDYTYITNDNGTITITKYTGPGGDVAIPASFNGLPVTAIGNRTGSAFDLFSDYEATGNIAFEPPCNITSIAIPATVIRIGDHEFDFFFFQNDSLFEGRTSLTNITVDDCNPIYSSEDGVLFTKDKTTLIKCPNGRIGDYTIPEGVETIAAWAFYSCNKLTHITLPESLSRMGELAIFRCGGLTEITIPNATTNIGERAFEGCGSLERISIGAGVMSSLDGAFRYCTGLANITVDSRNTNYCSQDGVLFNKSRTELIKYPEAKDGSYEIPEGVKAIKRRAFAESKLTGVSIPDSVEHIEYEAFYRCPALKEIAFGKGVITIGNSVFDNCHQLTSINLPDSVESIGANAFSYCTGVTNITLGSRLSSIGSGAFKGCRNLTSIKLPDAVTRIGPEAFTGCTKLTHIDIPASTTDLGAESFRGCIRLMSVILPNAITSIQPGTFKDCQSLRQLTLPESISSIKDSAFEGCDRLLHVNIPSSVTHIGNRAFAQCSLLTGIVLPDHLESLGEGAFSGCQSLGEIFIPPSLTTIPKEAFAGLSFVTNIVLQEGIASIGDRAFEWCQNLASLAIPASVTHIGNNAFDNCRSLRRIDFMGDAPSISETLGKCYPTIYYPLGAKGWKPRLGSLQTAFIDPSTPKFTYVATNQTIAITRYLGSDQTVVVPDMIQGLPVVSIQEWAFVENTNLVRVILSDGLRQIGNTAFYGCPRLTDLEIPQSVTNIDRLALSNCENLARFTVDARNPVYSSEEGVLFNHDKTTLILCPPGKTGHYSIPDRVISLAEFALSDCRKLESVTIPSGIRTIPFGAFSRCSSLTHVEIPDTVTEISGSAFSQCKNLKEIALPDSVLTIGRSAFSDCSGLIDIAIPDQVSTIERDTFSGCSNLANVFIPGRVSSIGINAFSACHGLEEVSIPGSVTNIAHLSWFGGTNLAAIAVDPSNTTYSSIDGVLYDKTQTTLLLCPRGKTGNLNIPASVTNIHNFAIDYRNQLSDITVDEDNPVYSSVSGVLYDKEQSKLILCPLNKTGRIDIPANTTNDLSSWRINHIGLSAINVDENNPVHSSIEGVLYSKDRTRLIFCPRGISGQIAVPASVVEIESQVFDRCSRLSGIIVDASNMHYSSVDGVLYDKKQTKLIKCPEGIAGSVTLPERMTSLPYYPFSGCSKLSAILVAPGNIAYSSHDGVLYDKDGIKLIKCPQGKTGSYTVLESTWRLAYYSFLGCRGLRDITLPYSTRVPEPGTFLGCTGVTNFVFEGAPANFDMGSLFREPPTVF